MEGTPSKLLFFPLTSRQSLDLRDQLLDPTPSCAYDASRYIPYWTGRPLPPMIPLLAHPETVHPARRPMWQAPPVMGGSTRSNNGTKSTDTFSAGVDYIYDTQLRRVNQ